jgi:glycosyltransferase involved in cell wall biosynthesis
MSEPVKKNALAHLPHGFGVERWHSRWKNGTLIGVNESLPYGYKKAEVYGFDVSYSTDHDEIPIQKAFRYILRGLVGFDIVHAWRNRKKIIGADVIWTHTESNAMAVATVISFISKTRRPLTIFQSIWLVDRWPRLNIIQKFIYKKMLSTGDILTFLSDSNAAVAQSIFTTKRVEFVKFGICTDEMIERVQADPRTPIRVLAVGSDRHRDWKTLRNALEGHSNYDLRIVTRSLPAGKTQNCEIVHLAQNADLMALYDWADVAVVPLKPNLHASGITAVQEATTRGVPVVCTDTGGLLDYFTSDEVKYVPVGDSDALRAAIDELSADVALRSQMVHLAQLKMTAGDLNSHGFAKRHAELSRELIDAKMANIAQ